MHARHRNQGHGLKANPSGSGPGTSGISPDRAAGYYSSENRSFNSRGYGRGQTTRYRNFQQASQSSQRSDIIMEAGKLAAEYLVSKGLLSPNSLPTNWKNGRFDKQPDEPLQEGRASVHSRLGSNNGGFDSRRRYSNEASERHHPRARRRGEIYRNEWGRDYVSNGPERSRVSPDNEVEDDPVSDYDNFDNNGKLTPTLADKKCDVISKIDSQKEEIFITREAGYTKENVDFEENSEKFEDNSADLAQLCRFSKVPTKTRSALMLKSSNTDEEVDVKERSQQNPTNDKCVSETKTEDTESVLGKPIEVTSEMEPENMVENFARSESFPRQTNQEGNHPLLERSNSLKERGEKRKSASEDLSEIADKQREWLSPFEKEDDNIHKNELNDLNEGSSDVVVDKYEFNNPAIEGSPKYSQEKQLFTTSYKICDLNLTEASHVNEVHGGYAPLLSVKDEEISMAINLSMNSNTSTEYATSGKAIEVIDLDSDMSPEMQELDIKVESGYEEGEQSGAIRSNYDGLHKPEHLHEVEPLGEDDSFFMTLEEIPLTGFVPPWQEPTTQHYDKPF